MFNPVSNGTGDFVVSTAVAGWQTPAQASAVDGATYRYRAASVDGSQWEIGTGTYTVSTTTLARTTVGYNSLGTTAKIAFTAPPQVTLTIFADDVTSLSNGNTAHAYSAKGTVVDADEVIGNDSAASYTGTKWLWSTVWTYIKGKADTFYTLSAQSISQQSNAKLALRNAGDSYEFGHGNPAGYGSTIGAENNSGDPYIAFNAEEASSASNSYRTRGKAGAVFKSDLTGGFSWNLVPNANADNQSLTSLMTLSNTGVLNTTGVMSVNSSNVLTISANTTITGGFNITPYNIGTISSGTLTPVANNGNYQYYSANGAHTIAAPATDCAIDILMTNGTAAGAITFSGYTVSTSPGDALTTTSTNKFILSIRRINSISTYIIKALQ